LKSRTICVAFAVVMFLFCAVRSVSADVSSVNFIGAVYKGSDPFYGNSITAYTLGTNVTVAVSVYNNYYTYESSTVNVSAVIIWFDWGTNYTSTDVSLDNPFPIPPYQSYVFSLKFRLPSDASNLVLHSYMVYVEHVDRLTGSPKTIVGTWTYPGSGFAVYAADQADAQNSYSELLNLGVLQYRDSYYYVPPIANFPYMPIFSSEARMLWTKARDEGYTGLTLYMRGDFGGAKSQFQTALDDVNQSLTAESEKGKEYEANFVDLMAGIGHAFNGVGDSVLILSIGIGIGAIMLGVGVLIYGVAKLRTNRTQPPTAKQS